ncbi:MAG: hypothetical protein IPJ89_00355 [Candidatus Iainarchaeum archaeon]|uniref:Uncharacterized protein n=1 Tax=Candidatus Iainarchaeum sp. TaxID=3101447 RepID=A0A7T9DJV6_9ARCH|nr:MAG: hypothetical protein IPJ89_00355 [Candidatus Diapherotrites archaeon]
MRDSIKQEIIDLLAKEKIQSSDQIFEKIGKIGDAMPLGRSKPSIYKAIQELRDVDKKIIRIKFNDFQAYGIKEKRENAIFYALSTLPNENEFYSKILDILASDDEKKQLVALEELGDVQRVKLNWETLEKVERIVARTKNEKLLETTAILLMNHLDAGIRPKKS